ncbi:XkdX family protein [Lacticaseibacillus saniviri]|nr:XkdX family protein [Lacticaseibacillus saniviri]
MMTWVLDLYGKGFSKDDLHLYVAIGWITPEEFQTTTGEVYQ